MHRADRLTVGFMVTVGWIIEILTQRVHRADRLTVGSMVTVGWITEILTQRVL